MHTKRVHEVVHTLRQKPVHVRENIALGVAGGVTFLVALLWFVANAAGGTFSLTSQSLAAEDQGSAPLGQAVDSSKNGFSQLLGAASAAVGASSSPTTITIVDTQVHSTLDSDQPDPNATVIHF